MCSTTFHSITKIKSIPAWIGGRRMKQIFGRPAGDVDWITRQHPIQSVENGLLLLVVGKWVYRGPVQSKRYWNFLSASSLKDSSCRDKTIATYGLSLFFFLHTLMAMVLERHRPFKKRFFGDGFLSLFRLGGGKDGISQGQFRHQHFLLSSEICLFHFVGGVFQSVLT